MYINWLGLVGSHYHGFECSLSWSLCLKFFLSIIGIYVKIVGNEGQLLAKFEKMYSRLCFNGRGRTRKTWFDNEKTGSS
jgi:hypothetical protein